MSFVPNDRLKSADSLELIVFPKKVVISTATTRNDIFTEHLAFWKSLVLRNRQNLDVLSYRTEPDETLKTLPPLAEIPIKGWGSFFEVQSGAVTPNGEIDFICVTKNNAVRR